MPDTMHAQPEVPARLAGASLSARAMTVVLGVLLGGAALLTLSTGLYQLSRPYDGLHAWIPAHLGIMARNFAQRGVIATHGVPLQNNELPGVEPDVYIHWPPLLPILLGELFRLTGVNEAAVRIFMLLVLVGAAFALGALGAECCGRNAGVFAAFAWLTMPVVVLFSKESMHLNLAIPLMVVAVLAHIKALKHKPVDWRWGGLSVLCWSLAALSSWEPVLAAPALLLLAVIRRNRDERRMALLSTLAVGASILAVLTVFLASYPAHAQQLWETVRYRLGLSYALPTRVPFHALADQRWYQSLPQPDWSTKLLTFGSRLHRLIGPIILLAFAVAAIWLWIERKAHGTASCLIAAVGLISPAALWYCVMTNHVYQHNVEMLLWTPAFALAAAFAYTAIEQLFAKWPHYRVLAVVLIAGCGSVMLMPLIGNAESRFFYPPQISWIVAYAHDIDRSTEPDAVVLTPEASMMTVYYSHRHIVRFVDNDKTLADVRSSMRGVFTGYPLYLAIPKEEIQRFPDALKTCPTVAQQPSLVLLKLPPE